MDLKVKTTGIDSVTRTCSGIDSKIQDKTLKPLMKKNLPPTETYLRNMFPRSGTKQPSKLDFATKGRVTKTGKLKHTADQIKIRNGPRRKNILSMTVSAPARQLNIEVFQNYGTKSADGKTLIKAGKYYEKATAATKRQVVSGFTNDVMTELNAVIKGA